MPLAATSMRRSTRATHTAGAGRNNGARSGRALDDARAALYACAPFTAAFNNSVAVAFGARHSGRSRRRKSLADRCRHGKVTECCGVLACAAAARCTPQAAIKIRMRFLQIADDFEVDALHLRQIDLLDVHESQ